MVNSERWMTRTRSGPVKIVVRVRGEAQVTLANFSARTSEQKARIGRAQTKWRRNGARAQTLFSREDPKTVNEKPDQLLAAAGIPSAPPQSPTLHNTDASTS